MKKRTGYLFRRKGGKHIPIGDPHHQDARIYLCYMVNYQRQTIALGTSDKREAEAKAAKLMGGMAYSDHEKYLMHLVEMGEMAKRELDGEQRERLQTPLGDVYSNYLGNKERPEAGEKTLKQYATTWTRFAKQLPKRVEFIEEVTKPMCAAYIDDLEANMKRTSCEKHRAQLKTVFQTISTKPNPWAKLKIMKADDRKEHRMLAPEECKALYKAATGELRLLILLGYSTGLRLKDCAQLRWSSVDLEKQILTVVPSKTKNKKPKPVRIPITANLQKQLAGIQPDGPHVLPGTMKAYVKNNCTLNDRIKAVFKTAGVFDSEEGKASFHCLRVTFQSMNDNAGTNRVLTRAMTGHSSAKMSDTYSRVDVERARGALEIAIPPL